MKQKKYVRIKKGKLLQTLTAYSLLSHSMQDWQLIVKEFNSLSSNQRSDIIKKVEFREKLLKEKISNLDEDMYLTCAMVNLSIVASEYNIDSSTVCLCISPLCKMNENIMVI